MGLKFNCANPECRQRIEVEDVLAGQAMPCPKCGVELRVPVSHDIKFICTNSECRQHVVVDVAEAGRFVKCPSCSKTLRVPGDPPKSFAPPPATRSKVEHRVIHKESRFAPLWRLCAGWGVGVVLVGVTFIAAYCYNSASAPPNLSEMAEEIYDRGLWGDHATLQFEMSGNAGIFFAQQRQADIEVFSVDFTRAEKRKLLEIKRAIEDKGFFWLGLSPRKDLFAYFRRGARSDQEFVVCRSSNGETFKTQRMNPKSLVTAADWLSDRSVVFSDSSNRVCLLNLGDDNTLGVAGSNGVVNLFSARRLGEQGSLISASQYQFVYVDEGNICHHDILTKKTEKLTGFSSGEVCNVQLHPSGGRYLFIQKEAVAEQVGDLYEMEIGGSPKLIQKSVFQGQWVLRGEGISFIVAGNAGRELVVETKSKTLKIKNPSNGVLRSYVVSKEGNSIYALSDSDDGGMAIYEYKITQDITKLAVVLEDGYQHSRVVAPQRQFITTKDGGRIDYYIVPPVNMDRKKKYPVFLDQTSSSQKAHFGDILLLSNAGILYVSPNNINILDWGVTPTKENTRLVYEELLKHPNVDRERIYISGKSATSVTACEVVNESQELWRGVILFAPVAFPRIDPSAARHPSVFMSVGENDKYNAEVGKPGRAEAFLLLASRSLVSARIDYQPAEHVYGREQIKESYKAAAKFILSDY